MNAAITTFEADLAHEDHAARLRRLLQVGSGEGLDDGRADVGGVARDDDQRWWRL